MHDDEMRAHQAGLSDLGFLYDIECHMRALNMNPRMPTCRYEGTTIRALPSVNLPRSYGETLHGRLESVDEAPSEYWQGPVLRFTDFQVPCVWPTIEGDDIQVYMLINRIYPFTMLEGGHFRGDSAHEILLRKGDALRDMIDELRNFVGLKYTVDVQPRTVAVQTKATTLRMLYSHYEFSRG